MLVFINYWHKNVFQVIQMTRELDIFTFIPLANNKIWYAAN